MFTIVAILIVPTALASYINHKFLRLPDAIGVMALAMGASLGGVLIGYYQPSFRQQAQAYVSKLDFSETVMHGVLAFLLFAGALHIKLEESDSTGTNSAVCHARDLDFDRCRWRAVMVCIVGAWHPHALH